MTPPSPDISGFVAAQNILIDKMGSDVVFHVRQARTYDPGVALDPESGEPYDPTAVPTSGGGFDAVAIRVGTVRRLLPGLDQVEGGEGGVMRTGHAAVAVKLADYPSIQDADEVSWAGTRYRVTDITPDAIGAGVYRYIVYLEAK